MTYFRTMEFNGKLIQVEYVTEGSGNGPSYSPMYGADCGDPLIVNVIIAHLVGGSEEEFKLTDEEREKIEADICMNHEFEDDNWEC